MLKTKRSTCKAFLLTTAVFALFALSTCRPLLLQDALGYVPVSSQPVGTQGGTVTDSRGASVVIPEGALAEATTITIAT